MGGRRARAARALRGLLVALLLCVWAPTASGVEFGADKSRVRRHHRSHRHKAKRAPPGGGKEEEEEAVSCKLAVLLKGESDYSVEPCSAATASKHPVAWGHYEETISEKGWGVLHLQTSGRHTDVQQAFAAGFLEGYATQERVQQLARLVRRNHGHPEIERFLAAQDEYVRAMAGKADPDNLDTKDLDNAYWLNVALVLAQMDGVLAGHNERASREEDKLSASDIWLINSDGDMFDIERVARPGRKYRQVPEMSGTELVELVTRHTRCSALVKWTEGGRDLLAAHATWDDYTELLRVYKHYRFSFRHPSVVSQRSSHSSYPGFVSSSDDFYVLDSGLVVIETTVNVLDERLFDKVDPGASVLAWIRNLVANRVAATGAEWARVFALQNSGTYNDQWMIVDYNQFRPGAKRLRPGTLWVLEQIPGYTESKDVTHILERQRYWASYNRPFFEEVNERSMYAHYSRTHGEMFSYLQTPRARIFKRDHSSVTDVASMQALMTKNEWESDPLSKGCPGNAVAARFDLAAPGCKQARAASGATDAKVTSAAWVPHLRSAAIAGPTHATQPPFDWSTEPRFAHLMHEGQPDRWEFDWVEMVPKY